MLYAEYVPILEECFALAGFPGTKALIFGFQDIDIHQIFIRPPSALSWKRKLLQLQYRMAGRLIPIPAEFQAGDLGEVLKRKGAESVDILDLFDQRANLRFDMNSPVAAEYHELYDSLIDLGSLEHVFDTRCALENCLRMVKPGGYYLLQTPVKGYFGHGLHTFNPEALVHAMIGNGFEIAHQAFSRRDGKRLQTHRDAAEVSIWLLGHKKHSLQQFVAPQQGFWPDFYNSSDGTRVMAEYRKKL